MEAVPDIADMHTNVPNLTLEQREAKLNVDQKRIFDKIKSHLTSQKEREDLLENESSRLDTIKPLRLFISGVGGTGKSLLIEAIKCLVDDIWHPKSGAMMCAIVAPTGIAAFNVGGLTIHRLFQLPIEHEGKTAVRHGCLTDETIDTLKSRVFNVSIQDKYKELESKGNNPPICLFSKVEACQKINELMLESLETE